MSFSVCLGWEDKVAVSLDSVFEAGSRHVMLSATKVLQLSTHSVTIDKKHHTFGSEIAFDFAVIATGEINPIAYSWSLNS